MPFFFEFIASDSFEFIIRKDSYSFRYVDHISFIYSQNNVNKIMKYYLYKLMIYFLYILRIMSKYFPKIPNNIIFE